MKLELKHIVGYLPYSIIVVENDTKDKKTVCGADRSVIYFEQDMGNFYNEIKPILRPISDLTKEIEVNGEKFIPIKIISELFFDDLIIVINPITGLLQIEIETNDYSHSVDFFIGHEIVQKLYEWHFDVHGLIGKNLAINITHQNPYLPK